MTMWNILLVHWILAVLQSVSEWVHHCHRAGQDGAYVNSYVPRQKILFMQVCAHSADGHAIDVKTAWTVTPAWHRAHSSLSFSVHSWQRWDVKWQLILAVRERFHRRGRERALRALTWEYAALKFFVRWRADLWLLCLTLFIVVSFVVYIMHEMERERVLFTWNCKVAPQVFNLANTSVNTHNQPTAYSWNCYPGITFSNYFNTLWLFPGVQHLLQWGLRPT